MANVEVLTLSEKFSWDSELIWSTSSWFNMLTSKVDLKSICYEHVYLIVVYEQKEKERLYIGFLFLL